MAEPVGGEIRETNLASFSLPKPPLKIPIHALRLILPHDYFSPGVIRMHGEPVSSLWAEAYFDNKGYYFVRKEIGAYWRLHIIRTLKP